MKIAILTPSRNRPNHLISFLKTVYSLAENKENVTTYNYIDDDDPKLKEYKELAKYRSENNKVLIGKPQSVSKSWNVLAREAIKNDSEILIMGNDDMIYRTYGWDQLLIKEVDKYPDRIFCMWFEDLNKGKKHCAFPIVSKEWYKALGYFTPGIFNFGYNDTWIFDIACRIKRDHFIPHIINEHLHWTLGKMEKDETTIRARMSSNKGGTFQLDKKIFKSTESKRIEAAIKLLSIMAPLNTSIK